MIIEGIREKHQRTEIRYVLPQSHCEVFELNGPPIKLTFGTKDFLQAFAGGVKKNKDSVTFTKMKKDDFVSLRIFFAGSSDISEQKLTYSMEELDEKSLSDVIRELPPISNYKDRITITSERFTTISKMKTDIVHIKSIANGVSISSKDGVSKINIEGRSRKNEVPEEGNNYIVDDDYNVSLSTFEDFYGFDTIKSLACFCSFKVKIQMYTPLKDKTLRFDIILIADGCLSGFITMIARNLDS